jgi:hypothetical protein
MLNTLLLLVELVEEMETVEVVVELVVIAHQ